MDRLALLGGKPVIEGTPPEELFHWPIVTKEDEEAILGVLRAGAMSGTDITARFEAEFAKWQGVRYALGFCNGTAALQAAMFACGIGEGDEMICPAITYWASCMQLYSLGATPVFADVDPDTLCIDPNAIEALIGPRTKAILAVHYLGHPADMGPIMEIADRHGIKVIEDVSHAQGGLYKGRMLGTFGYVAAMSLMSGKSFAVGEAGMLITDHREAYERTLAYAHYERATEENLTLPELRPYAQIALGGMKGRMNQWGSAMGLVQIKYYDERCREIRKAMNRFWNRLDGVSGLRAHRVDEADGSTMAGWYYAHGLYRPEELGGLSVTRFCEAVRAEGVPMASPGCNRALNTHGAFQTLRLYNTEKPTRIAHTSRDVRELDERLTVSPTIGKRTFCVPWFKKYMPEWIDLYAEAFRKVAEHFSELLQGDRPDPDSIGQWFFYRDPEK